MSFSFITSHCFVEVYASCAIFSLGRSQLVQAVPLPHLEESERPEAVLPINCPVHVDLEVAGDRREQLHIPQEEVLHPPVINGFIF